MRAQMTAQSHLTIRDYFDQLHVRHSSGSKGISRSEAGTNGNDGFQRLLATRQQLPSARIGNKVAGLTIADYRAAPVRACDCQSVRLPAAGVKKKEDPPGSRTDVAASRLSGDHWPAPLQCVPKRAGASTTVGQKPAGAPQHVTIERIIHKAARKYNLSPALIKGVIRAESNFQVQAVSRAGARGLMQLMPETARELGVVDPFDIAQNIDGGCRYLRRMLDSFDGDVKLALAAYNAGPGAVIKYGGQVPYRETRQYVHRVLQFSRQLT